MCYMAQFLRQEVGGSGGRSPPVKQGGFGGAAGPPNMGVRGAKPPGEAGGFGGPQAPQSLAKIIKNK